MWLFGLIPGKAWLALAVAVALTVSHGWAYREGKQSVYAWLEKERVKLIKDGKEIDDEVLSADDSGLCRLLGGCLPD